MSKDLTRILKINTWNLNNFNRTYQINKLQEKTDDELTYEFQKIIRDHHMKNDRRWNYQHVRSWEMYRPGREQELYYRDLTRRDNREKVAFLCKYVLNKKNINLPKK